MSIEESSHAHGFNICYSQSHSRAHDILEANNAKLGDFLDRARTSRRKKPPSLLDDSVLDFSNAQDIPVDDNESIVSATTFDFDNIIVNSRIYRETMRKYQMANRPKHYTDTQQPAPRLERDSSNHVELDRDAQLGTRDRIPSPAEDYESDGSPIHGTSDRLHRAFSFESVDTAKPSEEWSFPTDTTTIAQASETIIGDDKAVPGNIEHPVDSGSHLSESVTRTDTQPNVDNQKRNPSPMPPQVKQSTQNSIKYCGKCGSRLSGPRINALNDLFHTECFKCIVSFLSLHDLL